MRSREFSLVVVTISFHKTTPTNYHSDDAIMNPPLCNCYPPIALVDSLVLKWCIPREIDAVEASTVSNNFAYVGSEDGVTAWTGTAAFRGHKRGDLFASLVLEQDIE